MFKYLKNYESNKFKNHEQSYKKYWFKFIDFKIKIQYLARPLKGLSNKNQGRQKFVPIHWK
jgi:hypothetical protein